MVNPHGKKALSRRMFLQGAASVAGIGLFGFDESVGVRVRRQTIYLPNWDAEGFKVVQLTDLHMIDPRRMAKAVEAMNLAVPEKVDLMAITGDFVDSTSHYEKECLRSMADYLHDVKCPIVGVLGNHDWAAGPQEVCELMSNSRINILHNEAIEIGGVTVAGLEDQTYGAGDPEFMRSGSHSKSLLALWHEPDTVLHLPGFVSLQLSGHSHGGEVCLPNGHPLHTPDLAKIYTHGFYPQAQAPLYVSKGVATTGPCRIYCPPEINVLTLCSSQGGPARIETSFLDQI